ncbi:MAG: hypothetical protein JOY76_05420 [Hyphomicrobiales bacterium]|nr:hypothetical protein [Hyphomicrobiales bacterium]
MARICHSDIVRKFLLAELGAFFIPVKLGARGRFNMAAEFDILRAVMSCQHQGTSSPSIGDDH